MDVDDEDDMSTDDDDDVSLFNPLSYRQEDMLVTQNQPTVTVAHPLHFFLHRELEFMSVTVYQ